MKAWVWWHAAAGAVSLLIAACGAELPPAPCAKAGVALVEIMARPRDLERADVWLEIANVQATPAVLEGLRLSVGTGKRRKQQYVMHTPVVLSPGGLWVLGPRQAAHVDHAYADALNLPPRRGTVRLSCDEVVLDEVTYGRDEVPVPRKGHSLNLADGVWCISPGPAYDGENVGTPRQANPSCSRTQCTDASGARRPRQALARGDVQLSEIMSAPPGPDANRQWVELQVLAAMPVDLHGLQLRQTPESGPVRRWSWTGDGCATVAPGTLPVLAVAESEAAVALPWPHQGTWSGRTLSHGSALFELLDAAGEVLDAVRTPAARSEVAWSRDAAGTWCAAHTPCAAGFGTPGEVNPPCRP